MTAQLFEGEDQRVEPARVNKFDIRYIKHKPAVATANPISDPPFYFWR